MPLLALSFLKKLKIMLKLSEYGSASIFIYMLYVVIQFFVSLFKGEIDLGQV